VQHRAVLVVAKLIDLFTER